VSSGARPTKQDGASRKAGLVSVARALGVSPSTVSNAYNRPDQLSPALRERVLRTAAKLGYSGPDPVARSLRTGRAGAVGVIFHERLAFAFDDPAAVLLLQGLSEATDEHGLAVVLVPATPGGPDGAAVRKAAVDGLIVYGLLADDPLVAATIERRMPTVVVDQPAVAGVHFVGIDDRAAADAAVRHLLDLGHRRVAVLGFPLCPGARGPVDPRQPAAGGTVAWRRIDGCARALERLGLGWDEVEVEQCPTSTVEAGRAGAHAVLDRTDCTALFAFSDSLALGARLAARERGRSVPGDLSIIGFDGTAPAGDRLTSIHQPLRDKGRIAAQRLIRGLGDDPPAPGRELLPTRLVVGATTAAPAAAP
jgi:DNA-binding LacI/PurR family transcriptional regulator